MRAAGPRDQRSRITGLHPASTTFQTSARTASRCRAITAPICSTSATACGIPNSSFRAIPAKFSLLSARVVNPKGGNTEFADMRAAYDALDDETKIEIEDLICEHSLMYSRGSLGFLELHRGRKRDVQPVLQRLVRTHPLHGRKSLYLSSHAGAIVGMSVPESAAVAIRPYRARHAAGIRLVHRWTLHDLVMWDNRQTMHRVRRYDQSQPRDMRRATVAGTAPTVAQQAAE